MTVFVARRTYVIFAFFLWSTAAYADLPTTIEKIKPSIVAIGTYKKTQSPSFIFRGTGFVIGDGNHIATNAHVLPDSDSADGSELAVMIRSTHNEGSIRRARLISKDTDHDLAVVSFEGPAQPAMAMGDSANVREGQEVGFTGFPIGGALGFSPVTHRGVISAITPIGVPGGNSRQLNTKLINQLKRGSFNIFQLDATAYPGNSGSPVFNPETGIVIGVINMVFVKGSKESALSAPSGISYAIPINHLKSTNLGIR